MPRGSWPHRTYAAGDFFLGGTDLIKRFHAALQEHGQLVFESRRFVELRKQSFWRAILHFQRVDRHGHLLHAQRLLHPGCATVGALFRRKRPSPFAAPASGCFSYCFVLFA